jgi:DNA-binding NarL/FixJ family response regulator
VTIRVLVIDDHPAILDGITGWVARSGVAEVVAATSDPDDLDTLYRTHLPDIVLCDVHMPRRSGFDVCADLLRNHPDANVLLFSARDDATITAGATIVGARGLVSKLASSAELGTQLQHALTSVN